MNHPVISVQFLEGAERGGGRGGARTTSNLQNNLLNKTDSPDTDRKGRILEMSQGSRGLSLANRPRCCD